MMIKRAGLTGGTVLACVAVTLTACTNPNAKDAAADPSLSASPTATGSVANLSHVVTQDGAGAFISPVLRGGNLYIAQSRSGGSIYQWQLSDLPKSPTGGKAVTVQPKSTSTPQIASGVKMEQIAFDANNQNMFISKKSTNGADGGNSVWKYPWGSKGTTGSGVNLAGLPTWGGDGAQAWPGNNAAAAIAYTQAHFPPPAGTMDPTGQAIGNGGGVALAGNGFLYFGSLQSGCVYKQNLTTKQTWYVYCIPSWGANNQNQSIYSLDTDKAGNVYAMYQGSTDNNTIVLKIIPGGDGQQSDKISALQITGYARSVGLAVNADGTKIFADGVSMAQYSTHNTNTVLQINNPKWGTPEQPAANTPIATTIPDTYGTPWLTGLNLVDKGGNKGDKVYIADNTSGFWILYL